jgi:synaptobrevin family protein YKT6
MFPQEKRETYSSGSYLIMKLLCAEVFRMREGKTPIKLASASDVSSFSYWKQSTVKESFAFASRLAAQKTSLGTRQTIQQGDQTDDPYCIHVYVRGDGLTATVVTDKEYPERVAFSFLNKILTDFEKQSGEGWKQVEDDAKTCPPFLPSILNEFQNPKKADKLLQIEDTLLEIKEIMHKNISEVMERGETIESLVEKSKDLSAASKDFYRIAKKQNQCCKAW